jgi:large-conductance mechanosensitive channel
MQIPNLVENNIKSIISFNLKKCNELRKSYYNFIYNLICFLFITSVIYIILKSKYKKNTKEEREKRENEKRNYILYNLRKMENIL